MEALVLKDLLHKLKEVIESLVLRGSHRKSDANDTAETVKTLKHACICKPCLDIISRTHSAETARHRHHEHNLVNRWLIGPANYSPTQKAPEEVTLDGFAAEYLDRLAEQWAQGERKLDSTPRY
jgi:hypothetical protein